MVNDMVATEMRRGFRDKPEGKDLLWACYGVKINASLAAFEHFCIAGYLLVDAPAEACWRRSRWPDNGVRHAVELTATHSEKLWTYCAREASRPSLLPVLLEVMPQCGQSLRPASCSPPTLPEKTFRPHAKRPDKSAAGPGQFRR